MFRKTLPDDKEEPPLRESQFHKFRGNVDDTAVVPSVLSVGTKKPTELEAGEGFKVVFGKRLLRLHVRYAQFACSAPLVALLFSSKS